MQLYADSVASCVWCTLVAMNGLDASLAMCHRDPCCRCPRRCTCPSVLSSLGCNKSIWRLSGAVDMLLAMFSSVHVRHSPDTTSTRFDRVTACPANGLQPHDLCCLQARACLPRLMRHQRTHQVRCACSRCHFTPVAGVQAVGEAQMHVVQCLYRSDGASVSLGATSPRAQRSHPARCCFFMRHGPSGLRSMPSPATTNQCTQWTHFCVSFVHFCSSPECSRRS